MDKKQYNFRAKARTIEELALLADFCTRALFEDVRERERKSGGLDANDMIIDDALAAGIFHKLDFNYGPFAEVHTHDTIEEMRIALEAQGIVLKDYLDDYLRRWIQRDEERMRYINSEEGKRAYEEYCKQFPFATD